MTKATSPGQGGSTTVTSGARQLLLRIATSTVVARVADALQRLDVGIFWVDDERNVTEEWLWLDSLERGQQA